MFVITINQFLLHVLSVPLLSCRGYIVERRSEWRRDAAHGWPLLAPSWPPPPQHCTRHISIFSLSTATTWWRLLLSSPGCKTQWAAPCTAMMKPDMFHYTSNLPCGRRAVQAYCSRAGHRHRDCSLHEAVQWTVELETKVHEVSQSRRGPLLG